MKYVKLNVLLVFLILIIMSVGMVSAAENVSMDSDVNNDENLAVNSDVDLTSESDIATFTDLYNDIKDNQHDGVVELNRDYKFCEGTDDDFKEGITLDKLTINGNDYKIDADGHSRIFKIMSGPVVLNNIKFVNGHSPKNENGGAILVNNSNLEVRNCQFTGNIAEKYGGAIASSSSTNLVNVYNTEFRGNSAKYHGGAIYASDLNVDKSLFDSNGVTACSPNNLGSSIELKGLGGAIFASNVKVSNTKFKKNFVVNSGVYQIQEGGGAIAVTKKVEANNCNFTDNSALKGGAIIAIAPYPSDLNPSNHVKIINSRFNHNIAFDGGAICSNYNVTTDDSVFKNNIATGYGGGAINTGIKSNDNYFRNTVFSNNTSLNYGGALATSHSHIYKCTFENNKAKHGGAIFSLSFDIAESVLHHNEATVGNNIVVVDGFKKDEKTLIPESELVIYSKHEVRDFIVDVLNGQSSTNHLITSGNFEGYLQYCVEEYLFHPEHATGVMTRDLSYIVNSNDGGLVADYLKIMFYLMDAYPEKYDVYKNEIQSIIWEFTEGNYSRSANPFVRDIISLYNSNFRLNKTSYVLPNGTKMEYDMQLFLTPTNGQNMIVFKSFLFTPRNNGTVYKECLNKDVNVGDDVLFRITVENTGNLNLSDVFVDDSKYSKGLVFTDIWFTEKGSWTYKGNGVWVLDNELEPYEEVSLILVFNVKSAGNFINNVTAGYKNVTISKASYSNEEIESSMSVIKISNNKSVKVGDAVSFTIIVKNDGDCDLTGVYVIDSEYTQGLNYDYFVDESNSWKYMGNHRWNYDGILYAYEKTPALTLYFTATTTGLKYNTVTAGNNLTNETVNSTNTTNVTQENKKDIKVPTNGSDDIIPHKKNNGTHIITHEHNHTYDYTHDYAHYDWKATGNPLFALLLVLISLGVITFKRRK